MSHFCAYHPLDTARWHCSDCQRHYCGACMPDVPPSSRSGNCPGCGAALTFLGIADSIEPFWNRLPAFFKYPFHANSLTVIVGYSLLAFVFWSFFRNFIVFLLLYTALLKYLYYLVEYTADGHLTPPPVNAAYGDGRFAIAGKQLLVMILAGLIIFAAALIGGKLLAILATCLVILAIPASTLVLAMDGRVLASINPVFLMALITRIGWPYFVLYAHLMMLLLMGGTVQEMSTHLFPDGVGELIASLVNCYFAVISFHMLGYLLYQYQDKLGFSSSQQGEATEFRLDAEKRLDADIDIHLKEGRYARVQKLLLTTLKQKPDSPKRREQLWRLLWARDDASELLAQHKLLLPWLIKQPDDKLLAATLRRLIKADPSFALDTPALTYQCAQQLARQGHTKLALHLLKDFHRRFADASELALAYLLVAQLLANQLGDWNKAQTVLAFIDKRCAGHRLHSHIQLCLQQARAHQPLPSIG